MFMYNNCKHSIAILDFNVCGIEKSNKFTFLQIECQLLQYNTSRQLGCKFSPTPHTFHAVQGAAHMEGGEGERIPE